MITAPNKITFFKFLTPLITSGKKTITIRDKSESHYTVGSIVEVFTLEDNLKVCEIEIDSVEPIQFNEITQYHAAQECLSLPELKTLIRKIYPNTEQLYVISYKLIE